MEKKKRSRLSEIVESELKGGKGATTALSSAIGKRLIEKIDPRNLLFGGKGVGSLIGRQIFGKGYSATQKSLKKPTEEKQTVEKDFSISIDKLVAKVDEQTDILTIIAKNSIALRSMSYDMNVTKQNISKLVKLQGGTATKKSDMFFAKASEREEMIEAERKKLQAKKEAERREKLTLKPSGSGKSIFDYLVGLLGLGPLFAGLGALSVDFLKRLPIIGTVVSLITDFFSAKTLEEGLGIGKVPALIGKILGGTEGGLMNAFSNAGKWALIGAGIGSVVPGIGTLMGGIIGAVIGGIMGYFGGDEIASKIDKVLTSVGRMGEDAFDGLKDLGSIIANALSNIITGIKAKAKESLASVLEVSGFDEKAKELRSSAAADRQVRKTESDKAKEDIAKKAEMRETQKSAERSAEDVRKSVTKREYQAKGAEISPTPMEGADVGTIGSLSGKYESGGKGVATVSGGMGGKDPGGVSYGKYQLASKTGTMQAFLNSPEGKPFADFFKGLEPGTPEFTAAYKKVVAAQGAAFDKAQHDFVKRTHYLPVEKIASKLGFDTNNKGVQEALFSQSVQHGPKGNKTILEKAIQIAGPNASPEKQVQAIYQARSEYVSGLKMDESVKKGVLSRYSSEGKEAVALAKAPESKGTMVAQEQKAPAPVSVASASSTTMEPAAPKVSGTKVASASSEVSDGKIQMAAAPVVVNSPTVNNIQNSTSSGSGATSNASVYDDLFAQMVARAV